MKGIRRAALASALIVVAGTLSAQNRPFSQETGSFPLRSYSAREYGASTQNWDIAENGRGLLYVANSDGLLEFDGFSWKPIHLPNGPARSVGIDSKGGIYVGGQGEFGVLRPGPNGEVGFASLVARVPEADRQFLDVWRVLPSSRGVYFSSYSRLFRLNPNGTIKVWRPQTRFGRALLVADRLYVKTPESGLVTMKGDDLVPVPGGARLASEPVEDAVAFGDGVLIATARNLFRLTPNGIEEFATTGGRYLSENIIYSMSEIAGGEIAAGTRNGGLVLLSRDGRVDRIIPPPKSGGYITKMLTDTQGNVWLTYDQGGIAHFNPGLSRFDAQNGLGGVICSARLGSSIYVGTQSGLYRMQTSIGSMPTFSPIPGVNQPTWSLTEYKGELIATTQSGGVFLVSGDRATQILPSREDVLDASVSPRDSSIIYAAGKGAIYRLHHAGGKWDTTAVSAPREEFRTIREDPDGTVWATATGTIWHLDFGQEPTRIEKLGKDQGVPASGAITAQYFRDHIVFATEKGLLRYSSQSKHFAPDITLGPQFADGSKDVFALYPDPPGNVWVTGKGYHLLLRKQGESYQAVPTPLLAAGIDRIDGISFDPDGVVWATGDEGALFRWDPSLYGNPDRDFTVLTRDVRTTSGRQILYGGFGAATNARLPYRSNSLRFTFASPFYELPSAVEYRTRLDGVDEDWSPWTNESHKDYNLPEHSYTFHVQARSPHGAVSPDAVYSFRVLPPWYRTWWAYAIYLILAGIGVWQLIKWRTHQLEADKRRLEGIVEERTVEIRQQRDEIQTQERKSHALLLNILPSQVADELKSTGAVKPVGFEEVTVCFTDFVGFTVSSEKLPPGHLVTALNEYFTAFDEIVARYGLEKMKTIGDAYMFASGLPVRRASHAVDAVLAALDMAEVVRRLAQKDGGTGWNIRIGLHSGPVVAGVVGIRKFAFDIWGNTVNFAARMESSGVPGRVNMSERTWRLTRGMIAGEFRGDVKIKEGRELPMYLAEAPVPDFAERYRREFGEDPRSLPAAPNIELPKTETEKPSGALVT
ncbi:MAG: hypothetical protein KGN84_01700 [Acidobacteriota bacterium]|nr:hypothetical protein [Acidobacteriota bacterium]